MHATPKLLKSARTTRPDDGTATTTEVEPPGFVPVPIIRRDPTTTTTEAPKTETTTTSSTPPPTGTTTTTTTTTPPTGTTSTTPPTGTTTTDTGTDTGPPTRGRSRAITGTGNVVEAFKATVANPTPPADGAEGAKRLAGLRNLLKSMKATDRTALSQDRALLADARTFVGDHDYMSLVAALGMYASGGTGTVNHMSGGEADTFIRTALAAVPHLKSYLEAAVKAGKQADGFVAVVDNEDWKTIYDTQYPGKTADPTGGQGGDDANTNAFIANKHSDRPAIIKKDRGTRSTAIHESMHRYSELTVLRTYGSPLNEGITEYFTRKITDRDGNPAALGGPSRDNYDDNFDFVRALLPYLGGSLADQEIALAEIYFKGKVDLLETKFKAAAKARTKKSFKARMKVALTDNPKGDWDSFVAALKKGDWDDAERILP